MFLSGREEPLGIVIREFFPFPTLNRPKRGVLSPCMEAGSQG